MTLDPVRRAWHVVATSDQLDAGAPVPVSLLGERFVAFRSAAGAAVLPAACPHRGTDLALGSLVDGCLACPYHGWRYSGNGHCSHVPSLGDGVPVPEGAHSRALPVVEHDGLVWTSLDPDADPALVPHLPSAGDVPGMRVIRGEPMLWATSAGRHLENILDLAHFPFVHPGTFGCEEAERVQPHEAVVDGEVVRCDVNVVTRNPELPGGSHLYPELGPLITLAYHYRVELPYRVTLGFDFPDGLRRALHEVVTPTAPDRCTIHWLLLVDQRLSSPDEEELAFAHRVFAEDQPLIETQPPGVPVARRAEVHVPADKLAVAYRRALREAGMPEEALV